MKGGRHAKSASSQATSSHSSLGLFSPFPLSSHSTRAPYPKPTATPSQSIPFPKTPPSSAPGHESMMAIHHKSFTTTMSNPPNPPSCPSLPTLALTNTLPPSTSSRPTQPQPRPRNVRYSSHSSIQLIPGLLSLFSRVVCVSSLPFIASLIARSISCVCFELDIAAGLGCRCTTNISTPTYRTLFLVSRGERCWEGCGV